VPRPGAWLLVFVHSERLASRDPDASFRVNPGAPDPRSFPADVSGDTTEVALLGLRREGGHVQGRAHRPRRVGARSNRPGSWALLLEALEGDISDVQGGTTAEGVHLGAMAGTLDLLQRGLTGIGWIDGVLRLNPQLPQELSGLEFTLRHRRHWGVRVRIKEGPVRVTSRLCKRRRSPSLTGISCSSLPAERRGKLPLA
jgi:hypothetical protein